MDNYEPKEHIFLGNIYAFFCMIGQPILGMYVVPGTNLSSMAVMLILLLICCGFSLFRDHILVIDNSFFPYFIVIIFNTLLSFIAEPNGDCQQIILSTGQYFCYVLILFLFNRKYFDENKFYVSLIAGADISSFYLIIQEILAFFGIFLPGGLPFLQTLNPLVQSYTNDAWMSFSFYRPRSLFSEPAMFSTYVLLALLVSHNVRMKGLNNKLILNIREVLYIVSIIISRSTLGYLGLIFFAIIILFEFMKERQVNKSALVTIPAVVFVLLLSGRSEFIQFQINRLASINGEQRLQIFSNLKILDATTLYKILFGHDFALSTYEGGVFLPSFFRQFYCFGITGIVALFYLLMDKYMKISKAQRQIWLTFIVLMLGSELLHGGMLLLYFTWLAPYKELFYSNEIIDGN